MVGQFDYVVTMEDLTHGQRIGNYSIEFKRKGGDHWETLVPAVQPNTTSATATTGTTIIQQEEEEGALVKGAVGERDRPDGHDPRDQVSQNKRKREQANFFVSPSHLKSVVVFPLLLFCFVPAGSTSATSGSIRRLFQRQGQALSLWHR